MSCDKTVYMFGNGNTAVCKNGEQVPDLQRSWLILFVEFLASMGEDPTSFTYELPDCTAEVFPIEGGFNWRCRKR